MIVPLTISKYNLMTGRYVHSTKALQHHVSCVTTRSVSTTRALPNRGKAFYSKGFNPRTGSVRGVVPGEPRPKSASSRLLGSTNTGEACRKYERECNQTDPEREAVR